jgi:hypothetical protein
MNVDIYLWPVPSDANASDVRLREFTAAPPSGTVFASVQVVDEE